MCSVFPGGFVRFALATFWVVSATDFGTLGGKPVPKGNKGGAKMSPRWSFMCSVFPGGFVRFALATFWEVSATDFGTLGSKPAPKGNKRVSK